MFTGGTWLRAFIYSYNESLGNFNTDGFHGEDDKHYLYTLWFFNTLITLIIFLNMLIAIMGDTFGRVQETAENNMLKELASIMMENENLINRDRMFGDSKYIIVIQEEKAEGSHESWEGQLQKIKKYTQNLFSKLNSFLIVTSIDEKLSKLLALIEKDIQDEVREKAEKRIKELEVSCTKLITTISDKSDK